MTHDDADESLNRRTLAVAAAAGATGLAVTAAATQATAAPAAPGAAGGGRIDLHHHAMPPAVRAWLVDHGMLPPVGGPPFTQWSLGDALAMMDDVGTELAVVSAAIPSVFTPNEAQARELARIANEELAGLARDRPDRFAFLAYLPLTNVDDALAELDHAMDTLHADGVLLMSHSGTTYLGDPVLEPVMAALDRRSAVVLTHPFDLPGCASPPIPAFLADFLADTTRAAIQIIKNGVLDRYPNVSIILPHAGGMLPYQAARLALGQGLGFGVDAETTRRALRRFYYDTAGPMSPFATPTLLAAAGAERIVYGSDYNGVPPPIVAAALRAFLDDPALDPEARRRIGRDNALRLLPAVARRLGRR